MSDYPIFMRSYAFTFMGFVVCTLMAMAFTLRQLYYSVS